MKKVKLHCTVSLILNLLTFIFVTASIAWFLIPGSGGAGNMATGGVRCFRYFTNDSNIFAAVTALITLPFDVRSIKRGEYLFPKWLITLKMVSTAAVTLTMTVVILFLGPTQGYVKMFAGVCLYLHLLCPLFAIVSFCFFEPGLIFTGNRVLFSLLPTFLYGTVYLVNVVFVSVWPDFYGFNIGGMWYVSYIALHAVTYLFALCLVKLRNNREKRLTPQ